MHVVVLCKLQIQFFDMIVCTCVFVTLIMHVVVLCKLQIQFFDMIVCSCVFVTLIMHVVVLCKRCKQKLTKLFPHSDN